MPTQPPPHPATLDDQSLLDQSRLRFTRGSGPGGQHRNKVQTGVVLVHEPTGVEAAASERRSQAENRHAALHRLRLKLALQVRTAPAAGPHPLWLSRCRHGRVKVGAQHPDLPAILAIALDWLAACDWDIHAAAGALGCSPSQLVSLLKTDPHALALLNEHRRRQDLHPLR